MRFYPQLPGQRIGTISRDLLIVALLLLFALFGKAVHDAVDALAVLGEGVRSGGEAVRGGFESAFRQLSSARFYSRTFSDRSKMPGTSGY